MAIMHAILRAIVGAIFGFATALALVPALAAFSWGDSPVVAYGIFGLGALAGLTAPRLRRAFGRGFLMLGAAVFALPLTTMLLAGRAFDETISAAGAGGADQVGAIVGAGIAGALFTGLGALVGFFLGAILLIAGLVLSLGGQRDVIIVERKAPAQRREPPPMK